VEDSSAKPKQRAASGAAAPRGWVGWIGAAPIHPGFMLASVETAARHQAIDFGFGAAPVDVHLVDVFHAAA